LIDWLIATTMWCWDSLSILNSSVKTAVTPANADREQHCRIYLLIRRANHINQSADRQMEFMEVERIPLLQPLHLLPAPPSSPHSAAAGPSIEFIVSRCHVRSRLHYNGSARTDACSSPPTSRPSFPWISGRGGGRRPACHAQIRLISAGGGGQIRGQRPSPNHEIMACQPACPVASARSAGDPPSVIIRNDGSTHTRVSGHVLRLHGFV